MANGGVAAQKTRLAGVDVLRGISILLVVLDHIKLRFELDHYAVTDLFPPSAEPVVFETGYYAVIIFFVISGYLITDLSLRRWGPLNQLSGRQFYVMRAARILPCLLLLVAVLSTLQLVGFSDYVIRPERASLGRAVLAALTFHVNWLEGHHGYLPGSWDVLWSLSVEEVFYILFPIICLLLRSERLLVILLLALIIAGPINRTLLRDHNIWETKAYLSCADGIAFGCLAALASVRLKLSRPLLRASLSLGIAVVLLILVFRKLTVALGLTVVSLNVTLLELGVALMVLAFGNDVGNRIFGKGTGPLRQIGRYSYEIYLTHMFVVFSLIELFKISGQTAEKAPYWYAAILAISIALGYLVSRTYSEPINRRIRGAFFR